LQTFEGLGTSGIKSEVVCTNQEGKLYYVACYKYFIDLADLDNEFQYKGHFEHYKSKKGLYDDETFEAAQETSEIVHTRIPPGKYFLPFTMCLVSVRSYRE